MRIRLNRFLERLSVMQMTGLGLLLAGSLGGVNYLTGNELAFSLFFLVPVALVTWYAGLAPALGVAIFAALVWVWGEQAGGFSSAWVPVWNTLMRVGLLAVMAWLLDELRYSLARHKSLATRDGLTGLFNPRALVEISDGLVRLAVRNRTPVAVGYIDIDNFKQLNDTRGHEEGDRVLASVADSIRACTRTADVAGRMGGDEFVVFMPEAGESVARAVFGRVHERVLRIAKEHGWPIGLSMGVAAFPVPPESISVALRRADQLMYEAKHSGKNRLLCRSMTEPSVHSP